MKTGKSLENLVKHLEQALADSGFVVVDAPKKLRDRTTGRLRQHDVVLTIKQHHHELMIAIECRDRSRPITVNQVEGFWAKCQDTGIDQGVIVSSKGFYTTAKTKAAHLGVRCLTLEEATSFTWLRASALPFIFYYLRRNDWEIILPDDIEPKPHNFSLVTQNGQIVTPDLRRKRAKDLIFNLNLPFDAEGSFARTFVLSGQGLHVRDDSNLQLHPVEKLIVTLEFEVKSELAPYQFFKYIDKTRETDLTDLAIAPLKNDAIPGLYIMSLYDHECGGKIILIRKDEV